MAEERNLGLARAPEAADDADATKAELQRRMEEARESISQTVTEIKESVVNQYQQVRETISDSLDWREQYKRHTLPLTVGALAVGALVGYSVMGAFSGSDDEDDYDTEDALDRIEQSPRSYAASPITGASHASTAYQRVSHRESDEGHDTGGGYAGGDARPSYSSGYRASTAPQAVASLPNAAPRVDAEDESDEPKGPGLYERFKETKAYDKLQGELSTLGERFVEELSRTAQTVVVPALLSKLKSLIGIDLSTQREVAQRGRLEQQAARSTAGTAAVIDGHDEGQGRAGGAST